MKTLFLSSSIEIPQPLFWLLTTLVAGVISLLTYLWKSKDKQMSAMDHKLDKILHEMSAINTRLEHLEKGRATDTERIRHNELELTRIVEHLKH